MTERTDTNKPVETMDGAASNSGNEVCVVPCDYSNPNHLNALVDLLDHYMRDPMGDAPSLDKRQQLRLVDGLANHPSALVFFVQCDDQPVGLATCFLNFSTFKVKPYLYIHDIVILRSHRGKGLGRFLLEALVDEARKRGCCKITLEVREDNVAALELYKHLGFKDCEPTMYFWTKHLDV